LLLFSQSKKRLPVVGFGATDAPATIATDPEKREDGLLFAQARKKKHRHFTKSLMPEYNIPKIWDL
jgi:hypothetical protein